MMNTDALGQKGDEVEACGVGEPIDLQGAIPSPPKNAEPDALLDLWLGEAKADGSLPAMRIGQQERGS
jgi:hypothetical protein